MAQASPTSVVLVQISKEGPAGKHDLEAQASAALDEARAMPHGPERTEAMKKAGTLRNAALRKKSFPKQGRPPKNLVSAARKQILGLEPMDRKAEEASEVQRKSAVILSDRSREIIRLFEERERKRHQVLDSLAATPFRQTASKLKLMLSPKRRPF